MVPPLASACEYANEEVQLREAHAAPRVEVEEVEYVEDAPVVRVGAAPPHDRDQVRLLEPFVAWLEV